MNDISSLDDLDTSLAERRLKLLEDLLATLKQGRFDRHGTGYASAIGTNYNTFKRRLSCEVVFQRGKVDRLHGLPARSANGMYLNGWYFTQFLSSPHAMYCITDNELIRARQYSHSMPKHTA